MKKIIFFISIGYAFLVAGIQEQGWSSIQTVQSDNNTRNISPNSISTRYAQINNFTLKDLNNRPKSFSDLRGEKLTLVDFWATWCKPCVQAIPKLNKIYLDYQNKGVEIIGINADSPRNSAKVKPFAKTYKITYPILRDPNNEVTTELNVTAFPTLYIINPKNEIVYTHIGFRPGDEKLLRTKIDELLGQLE